MDDLMAVKDSDTLVLEDCTFIVLYGVQLWRIENTPNVDNCYTIKKHETTMDN